MSFFVLHLPEERVEGAPAHLHLPLDGLPDVTGAGSHADMRRILYELRPDSPPEAIARETERLWACTHNLAPEDILAIPLETSGEVAFAEVTGPVVYHVDRYELPVSWFEQRVKQKRFGRFKEIFEKSGVPLVEVHNQQARMALRAQLPLTANRFARLRWLAAALVLLQVFYLLMRLIKQEGGF